VFCAATAISLRAQTFTTLVTLGGSASYGSLVLGADGNFYGTTSSGGANGGGTVFKITTEGVLTTLYSFCAQTNCTDGSGPLAGLAPGTDGNFYGVTYGGGNNNSDLCEGGCGTLFKITPAGALTTLHIFCLGNCSDGWWPYGGLVLGTDGNLYGTTELGGDNDGGTVFKITPGGALTTLCSLGDVGSDPQAALIQGTDGNFYGTTWGGAGTGYGTVFACTPAGTLTTLHVFESSDGYNPFGSLLQGADGNFYGTTQYGGANGYGTVFKMTSGGTLTTLYNFCAQGGAACTDGASPLAGLVQSTDGNFYGTASAGGAFGVGTVFEITPAGTLTTLHSFDYFDGVSPEAGLVQGTDGTFFGTAGGTVFSLSVGLGAFVETVPTSGATGATVVILGNNLTGTTSVTFNGTAATFTVVSSTEITATVPVGATTGRVQVTTPSGTLNSNVPFQVAGLPQAATPTFSPAAGTYSAAQSVTLADTTAGAVIYYTTDGTTPTTASTQYAGAITVNSTETIEAIATASGYSTSAVAIATYIINSPLAATPTFSPPGGTYTSAQTVTISDATAGARIYYTTNGTNPTTSSTLYTGPIQVASTETIEAIATAPDYSTSGVATATYTIASVPVAAVAPASLVFGSQATGTSSAAQTVTLSNTGSTALAVAGISINGDFSQTNNCGSSVAAAGSCTISVTFKPTASGTRTGTLTITDNSNGASGSTQTVSLTGTGTTPASLAGVTPSSLSFAATMVNSSTNSQAVTLSNTGSAALAVAGIAASANFAQTNNCGSSVAAGGSCTINVTFSPTKGGSLTGTVTITDNSNNTTGSTQTVTLSGTGEDYTLTLASGSSSSASVSPGQSATYTLAVGSEGGLSQSVNFSCTDPASESTCAVSPNPGSPGSNITVTVSTTAASVLAPRNFPAPRMPSPPALLVLALLLASVGWTVRAWREVEPSRRRRVFVPLAAGLLFALALAGCGGGGSSSSGPPPQGTQPGTYNLTVTGTVGSGSTAVSHSMTLTLTVS